MARSLAEINEQNEKFINAVIGEMTEDGQEVITQESTNEETDSSTEEAIESDYKFEISLCNGEILVLAYNESDMDELLGHIGELEVLVDRFRAAISALYTKGYDVQIETWIDNVMSSFDIPVDYKKDYPDDHILRTVFKLTDALNIWTTTTHVLREKNLMINTFKLFSVSEEMNEIPNN
jgi:hypothetical protein